MLEKDLSNDLIIQKCISYPELLKEDLSNYDLIISNAPIHKNYDIPIINTNYIITMDDIIFIKKQTHLLFQRRKFGILFPSRTI